LYYNSLENIKWKNFLQLTSKLKFYKEELVLNFSYRPLSTESQYWDNVIEFE